MSKTGKSTYISGSSHRISKQPNKHINGQPKRHIYRQSNLQINQNNYEHQNKSAKSYIQRNDFIDKNLLTSYLVLMFNYCISN